MNILVADDDRDNRLTMKMMLELHGHRVELAANGLEAVELATQRAPDIAVMDIGMPVMDGFSATRILRERAETVAVPVVCVSADLAQSECRNQAYEAGCIACVVKPVFWEDFVELLVSLEESHRQKQE
jgi:CheY-like chemotaxis protein